MRTLLAVSCLALVAPVLAGEEKLDDKFEYAADGVREGGGKYFLYVAKPGYRTSDDAHRVVASTLYMEDTMEGMYTIAYKCDDRTWEIMSVDLYDFTTAKWRRNVKVNVKSGVAVPEAIIYEAWAKVCK